MVAWQSMRGSASGLKIGSDGCHDGVFAAATAYGRQIGIAKTIEQMHLVGELSEALQIGSTGAVALEEGGHRKIEHVEKRCKLVACVACKCVHLPIGELNG